uniref:Uncharacterized protein n=1 Tax=Anopheles atroparvus TaxID=41427 RepID=A0A182J7N0_ANOAO
MMRLGFYLAASWTILCTYGAAMPDIHRHMSPAQLQEVFHVDHVDLVPHYELIKLTHHTNTPLLVSSRRKRSIETGSSSATVGTKSNGLSDAVGINNNHHVKKDLSKVRFTEKVSELPAKPGQQRKPARTSSDSATQQVPLEAGPLVNSEQQDDATTVGPQGQADVSIAAIAEHRVSFPAFGENVNLTLRKTEGLLRGGAHSLRMWNVRSDPNSTQGLVYEEIHDEEPEPANSFGDIYQDEDNMAAILMRKHLESGDLMMPDNDGAGHAFKDGPVLLGDDYGLRDGGSLMKQLIAPRRVQGCAPFSTSSRSACHSLQASLVFETED